MAIATGVVSGVVPPLVVRTFTCKQCKADLPKLLNTQCNRFRNICEIYIKHWKLKMQLNLEKNIHKAIDFRHAILRTRVPASFVHITFR